MITCTMQQGLGGRDCTKQLRQTAVFFLFQITCTIQQNRQGLHEATQAEGSPFLTEGNLHDATTAGAGTAQSNSGSGQSSFPDNLQKQQRQRARTHEASSNVVCF